MHQGVWAQLPLSPTCTQYYASYERKKLRSKCSNTSLNPVVWGCWVQCNAKAKYGKKRFLSSSTTVKGVGILQPWVVLASGGLTPVWQRTHLAKDCFNSSCNKVEFPEDVQSRSFDETVFPSRLPRSEGQGGLSGSVWCWEHPMQTILCHSPKFSCMFLSCFFHVHLL